MEHAQAMMFGKCGLSTMEIAATLSINVAHPFCKPLA
jgi:hypothetical protein